MQIMTGLMCVPVIAKAIASAYQAGVIDGIKSEQAAKPAIKKPSYDCEIIDVSTLLARRARVSK